MNHERTFTLRRILIGVVFLTMVGMALSNTVGCATFTTNSFRTLSTSAIVYDTTMKSLAELYAQEKLTEVQKEKAIELGTYYWSAYHTAVDALAAYETTLSAADEERVNVALNQVSAFLAKLIEYLQPFLGKEG